MLLQKTLPLTFQEALVGGGQSNTWGQLLVRERCEQVFFYSLFSLKSYCTANERWPTATKIQTGTGAGAQQGNQISW